MKALAVVGTELSSLHVVFLPSLQSPRIGTVMPVRKLKNREVKELSQGHTVKKWQEQLEPKAGLLAPPTHVSALVFSPAWCSPEPTARTVTEDW